jgi:hypothetical protein
MYGYGGLYREREETNTLTPEPTSASYIGISFLLIIMKHAVVAMAINLPFKPRNQKAN